MENVNVRTKKIRIAGWIRLLAILLLLNFAAQLIPLRIDLTAEKRYSLSPATREMLENIKEPITIDILLKGEFPAVFMKLKNSATDLLDEMQRYGGHNIVVKFSDVNEWITEEQKERIFQNFIQEQRNMGVPVDSILQQNPTIKDEFKKQLINDTLKKLGIMPYTLQVQQKENEQSQRIIFPSAIVRLNNRAISIDLLSGKTEYSRDPLSGRLQLDEAKTIANAEALLEFQFANAIDKIQRKNKPTIGYLTGNGQPTGPETNSLVQTLESDYRLSLFNLNQYEFIPKELSALLIVKPTIPFSDSAKLKIDQYLMNGGKIIWFLDMLYAEKDSLALTTQTLAYDRNLQLDDLLFKYGVRINRDLLQDLQCDLSKMVVGVSGGQPQLADVPFNYYPLLQSSASHSITKNLEPVLTQFVNTIDTVKAIGVSKHILLQSSENAKTVSTPAIISLNELRTVENPQLYRLKNKPVVVLLEGNFSSLYANRASTEERTAFEGYYGKFSAQSVPTAQIIAGDGDIILNQYTSKEPFEMGYSRSQERLFANKLFLQNSLEYLTGNTGLLNLRSKELTVRLLNRQTLEEEKLTWQIIMIGSPILLIVIGWLSFGFLRKKTFQKN